MPLVSVIVPVYNAERHIGECLRTIRDQTLTDFELLLVDDGSTDSTPSILAEFAAGEPRARVLKGPGRGTAGAARNAGIAEATGDYLAFLDADDYFLPTMLEELHAKAVEDDADVVACKFAVHNELTGEVTRPNWMLQTAQLPADLPFAGSEVGDQLFAAFNPAAWNKLFRAAFIREKGIAFQELRRTNDAYFTFVALALADRITYLDAYLVNYRVANSSSLQATVHEDPLEFVQALEAIRATLKREGRWAGTERAFAQLALNMCVGNLKRQTDAEAFFEVYEALRGEILARLDLLDAPDDYFFRKSHVEWRRRVIQETPTEYLFQRATMAEANAEKQGFAAREAARRAAQGIGRPETASVLVPAEREPEPDVDDAGLPDVSVIIPVYNTVTYLAECIGSAQRQTGCSVEIVCIDDGSTDGSGEVLDRYAAADPRIRVVHQENAGLSRTRNAGVALATGRYLCFLDSDDYWQGDLLAELVGRADEDALDVLMFDAVCVREPGVDDELWSKYESYYERKAYEGAYEGARLMAAMNAAKEYRASACLYLMRRGHVVAQGVQFYPGIAHEDNLYTFSLLLAAGRAGHSQAALYARRVRPDSIVTAGSRLAAAQGYFLSWVEMVRLLHGRHLGDAEVTHEIAAIVHSIYAGARRSGSRLQADMVAPLADVDPGADAAALFRVLKRGWSDDRTKRRLDRKLKHAWQEMPVIRGAKQVLKRVLRRG